MTFALEYWLWCAALLVPLCIALLRWGSLRRRKSLDRVVAPRLHETLVRSVDHRKRLFKGALVILALAALLVSLARPLYGLREAQVERAGVDILIALDVSRSMMAEDAPSNRLASAKAAITRLLDRPSRDRYGLIIFAGEAYLMAPITPDHGAVERSLNAVTTTSISKPGTDLAAAIKLAQRSYDETQKRGKALVLMSDGEQLQGDAVIAARETASKGISIFAVGIGTTTGARVPERQWGQVRLLKNEFGHEVVSRLNENVLRQVAGAGRGFYAALGPKGEGLLSISERGLQSLAKGTQIRQTKDLREYFQWPLGFALALLFWELLVNERKKSHLSAIMNVPARAPMPSHKAVSGIATKAAILTLLFCSVALSADLRDAKDLLRQDQPAKAADLLRDLRAQHPDDPWLTYDSAVTAYVSRDYQQADKIWQELAATELPAKLRDKVWTQIGNVSFRLGEQVEHSAPEDALPHWEQSREAYRVVLAAQPKDKMAVHNLKVVELRLAKLHAQLAQRLLKEAEKKSIEQTIEKLQAALDHQRTAQELDPQNEQYKQDVQKTEQQLAAKVTEKAVKEEKKADNALNNPTPNDWETKQAEEHLKTALADFQEAKTLDPQNQEAPQGEKRVEEKLANLLAKEGRQLQRQAQNESNGNPDQAVEHYEKALDKFEEALALDQKHEDAQAGEKEVKEALEQLHLKEGDKLAESGRKDIPRHPDAAAEKMMNALEHYQEARAINPENPTIPPKIEALQKELPDLLVSLGQKEQQQAAKDEPNSAEKAVAHLEKAATSFEMAQELDKQNEPARQGEEQVQKDLARLRQLLAQNAEARNQPQPPKQSKQPSQQKSQQPQQAEQSFESLLSQVKDPQKQKEYDESRRGKTQKYDPDRNRTFKNW